MKPRRRCWAMLAGVREGKAPTGISTRLGASLWVGGQRPCLTKPFTLA